MTAFGRDRIPGTPEALAAAEAHGERSGILAKPSPDLAILRHLAERPTASAAEVGIACRITAADVRARLATLETVRLVASRQDARRIPPARVYSLTAEGRRKAGIGAKAAT